MELNKCGVGIVTFNPDLSRFEASLKAVSNQFENIIIFDNNSSDKNGIVNIIKKYKGVVFIGKNENMGLGVALNAIMEYFSERKIEWVLLLDQDSVIPSNLFEEYSKMKIGEDIAIICPSIYDANIKSEKTYLSKIEAVGICITSGSFNNVRIWNDVGGFREDFFIDAIDNEYCIRLFVKKYKILRNNEVVLNHELGKSRKTFMRTTSNHNSIRRFYISRNSTYVAIKYSGIIKDIFPKRKEYRKCSMYLDDLVSVSIHIRRQVHMMILIFIYESDKCRKVFNIIRGVFAGYLMYVREK